MEKIGICDTTLRDGEQTPGIYFSREQKIDLAKRIDEFGVELIELMPASSKEEQEICRELSKEKLKADIRALTRTVKKDIDLAIESDVDRLLIWTPVSDIQIQNKLKSSKEGIIEKSIEAVEYAKQHGLKIDFGAEDASRADWDYVVQIAKPFERYIRYYTVADTLGCFTPEKTKQFFGKLSKELKCRLEFHAHNDFGMATANTLTALQTGANAFTGTFCGIGERAGNTAIEEIVIGMKFLHSTDMEVKYGKIVEICSLIQEYTGLKHSPTKPWIGDNAFTHETGIHIDAVLKNPSNYEHFDPTFIGQKRRFLYGKHSGRAGLKELLKNYNLPEEAIEKMLENLKQESAKQNRSFSADETVSLFKKRGYIK